MNQCCPLCHQPASTTPLYTQALCYTPNNAAAAMPANVYYPTFNCNAMAPPPAFAGWPAPACAGGYPLVHYNVVI